MKKGQKGFTLVELLIVIAIIGILAAVAIPRFQSADNTAKIGAARATLTSIESAAEIYKAKNNAYPGTMALLMNDAEGNAYLKRNPNGTPVANTVYTVDTNGIATVTIGANSSTLADDDADFKTTLGL